MRMTLARRILRVLSLEYGGPRKKSVLVGLADRRRVELTLKRLIAAGQVKMIGERKGARYALAR